MIKLISKIIMLFLINIIGLTLASYFVEGFSIVFDPLTYLKVAAIFTILNILVKPVLKLILGPLLIITFGLGILVVNALVLYILYKVYPIGVSIDMSTGLYPLIYATLIISAVHFTVGFVAKKAYSQ
jgi:putative membrane protein